MNTHFSASSAALGFLNYKLQQGILLGIVGTASVVGVTVSVINSDEIAQKLSIATQPISNFISTNISPHISLVKTGASKISKVFLEWSNGIASKGDGISSWIKKQKIENISKGFMVLVKTFGDWSSTLKSAAESVWSSKDEVLKVLNLDYIAKILVKISEFSFAIKELLSTLSNLAFLAAQSVLSPSSNKDQESKGPVDSFKKILMSGQLKQFLTASWQMVSENQEAVKKINSGQVKQLLNYAASNMPTFVARVNSLKESAAGSESTTGWGHYKNAPELINAIMNNSWGNLTVGVLNLFSRFVTKCEDKSKCNEEDAFLDTLKAFATVFKGGDSQKR